MISNHVYMKLYGASQIRTSKSPLVLAISLRFPTLGYEKNEFCIMHLQLALAVIHIANAALLPAIAPRGPGPGCEPEYEDIPLAEFNYGTTEDSTAGIGAEFEAPFLQFKQKGCSLANTFQAKRKKVTGRAGTNFWLSVDTSSEFGAGTLVSEYVLDGTKIKVGDGSAAAAGKAVQDDFVSVLRSLNVT